MCETIWTDNRLQQTFNNELLVAITILTSHTQLWAGIKSSTAKPIHRGHPQISATGTSSSDHNREEAALTVTRCHCTSDLTWQRALHSISFCNLETYKMLYQAPYLHTVNYWQTCINKPTDHDKMFSVFQQYNATQWIYRSLFTYWNINIVLQNKAIQIPCERLRWQNPGTCRAACKRQNWRRALAGRRGWSSSWRCRRCPGTSQHRCL